MFEKGIHNLHEKIYIKFFSNDNKDGVNVVGRLFDKPQQNSKTNIV
jgi:hypothetical protein